jgi:hypothetical protein
MNYPNEAGRVGAARSSRSKGWSAWDSQEFESEFELFGFLAPYVLVLRKADLVKSPPNKSYQFWHSLCFINNA